MLRCSMLSMLRCSMVAFFPFFIRLFRWIVDIGNLVVLHGYGLTLKAYLYISTTPLLFGNAEKTAFLHNHNNPRFFVGIGCYVDMHAWVKIYYFRITQNRYGITKPCLT